MRIQSLGWEDPLEKGIATPTPAFLPGESHGQRSLVGIVHVVTRGRHDLVIKTRAVLTSVIPRHRRDGHFHPYLLTADSFPGWRRGY